jgi:hypothetical protein
VLRPPFLDKVRSYFFFLMVIFTSILEHLSCDFEKTTITAMYHGRWFAYKQTNKYFYCQYRV